MAKLSALRGVAPARSERWPTELHGAGERLQVNGQAVPCGDYRRYHRGRIARTLDTLRRLGARRVVEIGGHPWVMTAELIDEPAFQLCATVSAQECTRWPDDIGVRCEQYQLGTSRGNHGAFINYAANIERTLFDVEGQPDTVLACEIIEHLIRAPHVMLLNINRWLPTGGHLLLTSPNGAQFQNPLRRRSLSPAYRCEAYERHAYLYTLEDIVELVSLCGFRIAEAGYWDVYSRTGATLIYGMLGRLPGRYWRDKFQRTIYTVAIKERPCAELPRPPRVYDPRGDWEYIAR